MKERRVELGFPIARLNIVCLDLVAKVFSSFILLIVDKKNIDGLD